MRDHLFFFVNGQPVRLAGRSAFGMLAPFLRRERGLCGTKIACAHGACGSCSVLLGRPEQEGDGFHYQPINSCIFPVWACEGAHLITVEGLNGPQSVGGPDDGVLSPVQRALVECHGTQCGFCTPGFAVTLSAFYDNRTHAPSNGEVCAALEGNLCRCTGYTPIIEAAQSVEIPDLRSLNELYPPSSLGALEEARDSVLLRVVPDEWEGEQTLFVPRFLEEARRWKAAHPGALVVAGATEVGVAMSVKGLAPREILSLSGVEGLDEVAVEDGALVLGARATWTQVAENVRDIVPEFAQLLNRWGSPQLRNAGTVAGNILRASPISDSLPFLLVCGAQLEFMGVRSSRRVPVATFLEGEAIRPDELLRRVVVPLPEENQTLRLFKVSKRRAFDRSIVSAAFLIEERNGRIENIKVAFGGVAPKAIRLKQTEDFLRGQPLETATWREARKIALTEVSPASDASASREYRLQLVAGLLQKFGTEMNRNTL